MDKALDGETNEGAFSGRERQVAKKGTGDGWDSLITIPNWDTWGKVGPMGGADWLIYFHKRKSS